MSEETQSYTLEEINGLMSLADLADALGCSKGQIRRATKKGLVPGHVRVLDTDRYSEDALTWEPPEGRGAVVRREDGRKRYHVYCTEEELAALTAQGLEVVDPAQRRKARRAARKAKEGAVPSPEGEETFDNFDA